MTKRLQVILQDSEFREIQRMGRSRPLSVAEWVRQALDSPRRRESVGSLSRKLEVIRTAAQSEYSVRGMDDVNQLRPSRFWARTRPRGVGRSRTEMRPSASSRSAPSRTLFIAELASCIRISP